MQRKNIFYQKIEPIIHDKNGFDDAASGRIHGTFAFGFVALPLTLLLLIMLDP